MATRRKTTKPARGRHRKIRATSAWTRVLTFGRTR